MKTRLVINLITINGLQEKGLFERSFTFNVLTDKINSDYPSHWHNAVELVYSLKSDHSITVNGKEFLLKEKDLLIIASGDLHSVNPKSYEGIKIYIQINNEILSNLIQLGLLKALIYQTRHFSFTDIEVSKALEDYIMNFINSFNTEGFNGTLFQVGRICDIFSLISRSLNFKLEQQTETSNKKIYGLQKINKSFEFIEENYHKDITLKDVSKATAFSETYFSKIFKEIYGNNFRAFLSEFRIKKAEKLLMQNLTITEVALQCGFNSTVTFNRTFKDLRGCTPSDYIKMQILLKS